MRETRPGVYVTFNGDYFDFPFIEVRSAVHGMDMHEEIGFRWENIHYYNEFTAIILICQVGQKGR
jgi:DNA polymerase epsilon subunit 1